MIGHLHTMKNEKAQGVFERRTHRNETASEMQPIHPLTRFSSIYISNPLQGPHSWAQQGTTPRSSYGRLAVATRSAHVPVTICACCLYETLMNALLRINDIRGCPHNRSFLSKPKYGVLLNQPGLFRETYAHGGGPSFQCIEG